MWIALHVIKNDNKFTDANIGRATAHTINVGATISKHGNMKIPVKLTIR